MNITGTVPKLAIGVLLTVAAIATGCSEETDSMMSLAPNASEAPGSEELVLQADWPDRTLQVHSLGSASKDEGSGVRIEDRFGGYAVSYVQESEKELGMLNVLFPDGIEIQVSALRNNAGADVTVHDSRSIRSYSADALPAEIQTRLRDLKQEYNQWEESGTPEIRGSQKMKEKLCFLLATAEEWACGGGAWWMWLICAAAGAGQALLQC